MRDVREYRRRAAVALRWRPEWRVAVVVVLAWAALLAGVGWHGGEHGAAAQGVAAAGPPMADHHLHHGHAMPAAQPLPAPRHQPGGLPAELPGWTLMAVAMMVPVTLPAVRHVGLNSIRRRRHRAMALYLAVYVAIWVAFGVPALAAERLARETLGLDGRVLLVGALAVAAGWQLTRVKRRALFRCRRTVPLPPVGLRADAGCARFALRQGWRCVTSCWALMMVMVVAGHASLLWMTALTALFVVEEQTLLGRRLLRPSAVALILAAGLVALGV
jgi:predicted metal-binding membrane protein